MGFFDYLGVEHTADRALDLGKEPDALAIFVQLHMAPRILSVDGCLAEPMACVSRSILMGCSSSTRMARAFTHKGLEACRAEPNDQGVRVFTGSHVDDVSQQVLGKSLDATARTAIRAGRRFAWGVKKMKLKMSAKSRLLASSSQLATKVGKALRARGIPLLTADNGEDLGIAATAGARRGTGVARKRLQKGGRRSKGVAKLLRWNKAAR